ncbi:MAG: phosphotransferase [bacterium]
MNNDTTWLMEQTREQLKLDQKILLKPLDKGGSDRVFYRVDLQEKGSCILMHYGEEKEENRFYVAISSFLRELGVNVPRILHHDETNRLVWMEDLGENDLHAWRALEWADKSQGYRRVLRSIRKLHDEGLAALQHKPVKLMKGFDAGLYQWEQNYFWEQFVQGVCRWKIPDEERQSLNEELAGLTQRLCALPLCLVHRDFQSHNIMMIAGEAYLIDFQGMRVGARFYDLGSLLFDPYVEFEHAQRLELLAYYYDLGQGKKPDWKEFQKAFYDASVQRLMQALGAYGFLGLQKGKTRFLDYIPSALQNLNLAASHAEDFPKLLKLVSSILWQS